MLKTPLKSLAPTLVLALLAVSKPLLADDTEIYVDNGGGGDGVAPKVMFHIEYTSNLASTVCDGADTAEGLVTWDNLLTACPTLDFRADPTDPNEAAKDLTLYMAPQDVDDGKIDLFEMVRAALKRVLAGIGNVDVGLVMPHAQSGGQSCSGPSDATNPCTTGGYILHRMVSLKPLSDIITDFDPYSQSDLLTVLNEDANKQALFDSLDALSSPQGNYSHEAQHKEVYFELFRYLTGQGVYNGHNGWVDFGTDASFNLGDWSYNASVNQGEYICAAGFTCSTTGGDDSEYVDGGGYYDGDFAQATNQSNHVWTGNFMWDSAAESGDNYISPLENCSKVFVVNVLDGGGNAQEDSDDAIDESLANGGMGFGLAGGVSNDDNGFVEMVRWLHDKDLSDGFADKQSVTSFFIAKHTGQVDEAASAGGTGSALPLTEDAGAVVQAIEDIFSNIISVSTTFVAASIPVNVFNRSEVLDNAYIALFQVSEASEPSWVGNVKKLKLEVYKECKADSLYDTDGNCLDYDTQLRLIDADSDPAISDLDGRVLAGATTFWTEDGYDLYEPYSLYPDTSASETLIDGKDGRTIFRGGAGQQIPGFLDAGSAGNISLTHSDSSGRQVYYLNDSDTVEGLDSSDLDTIWRDMYEFDPTTPSDNTYKLYQWVDNDYQIYLGSLGIDILYRDVNGNPILDAYGDFIFDPPITGDPTNDLSKNYAASCNSFNGGTWAAKSPCTVEDVAANVIAYIRGKDPTDQDGDGIYDEARRWLVGDPLHSRPLPINYGARGNGYDEANPDIRLLVGSNDGFLRMIRNTNIDGTESGEEDWAFLPREFIAMQKQLMDNVHIASEPEHPYGLDGPVSAYIQDADGTITAGESPSSDLDGDGIEDKVWIFFGLRRGGSAYYAFDITDPDAKPVFKWKIDPTTTGYSELGMTFSQPVVRELKWGSNTDPAPVLIIGAGLAENKDLQNADGTAQLGTNDTNPHTGNAVYVIDANDGSLIHKFTGKSGESNSTYNADMFDSIPSQVTAVDGVGDGLVDHAYVGDTGGNVWRIDMNDYDDDTTNDVSQWTITKLMQVGRHDTADVANDRRFFHAPDVVPARDTNGRYFGIVIGSGNRAHPLQLEADDYMFMYKDRCVGVSLSSNCSFTGATGFADLFDATDNCNQEVNVSCDVAAAGTELAKLDTGWKLELIDQGEKSLSAALTVRGVVYFGTYVPADSISNEQDGVSCGPEEGGGYQYAIALGDARAVINYDTTNTEVIDGQEHELQQEDRRRDLLSGGIAAENVYVSFRDEDTGLEYHGILSPDLQPGADLGAQQWRSYWMELNK